MRRLALLVLFTFICSAEQHLDDQPSTPLNGKHLRLITLTLTGVQDVKRNSTGHVVQTAGPSFLAIEWLSRRYNFTYSFIPIIGPMTTDDSPNQRGAISFIRQGEAELHLSALVATLQRYKYVDFSTPWLFGSYSILIPIPNSSTNIGALIEPMSTEVWICIGLSIPTVMASLFALSKSVSALNDQMESKPSKMESRSNHFQITDYVVSVLLSQGGYCAKKQLAIRLAAAAWCLACFVLVQAYGSTLIAFIMSPNTKPIINSLYDIPNVPGLKITVKRNEGVDAQFLETNVSFFKKLADSLREDPSLRCNKTEICLDKVRSGNHVYIHGEQVLQKIITMDRKETGACHFTTASKSFWQGQLYFFLPKESPYTETINRGMHETGLLAKWADTFNPKTKECSLKTNKKKTGNLKIALKNLFSVFALLILGICISIIVIIVELIYHLFRCNSTR